MNFMNYDGLEIETRLRWNWHLAPTGHDWHRWRLDANHCHLMSLSGDFGPENCVNPNDRLGNTIEFDMICKLMADSRLTLQSRSQPLKLMHFLRVSPSLIQSNEIINYSDKYPDC